MRKQIKTIVTAAGMAVLMAGTTVMPAFANSTSVKVGVVASAADVVTYSVTVPTTLAMAVVADQSKKTEAPQVMMGSSVTGGVNSLDAGSAELEFRNESKKGSAYVAVNINKACVKTQGASWKLKNAVTTADTDTHAMQFVLGNKAVAQVAGTNTYVADFTSAPIELAGNATQTVAIDAKAGGTNEKYTANEDSATAYTIEWQIAAK